TSPGVSPTGARARAVAAVARSASTSTGTAPKCAAITTTGSARAVRGGSNAVASNTGPLFAERPPSRGTARSYPDTMADLTAWRLARYQAGGTVGKWQREEL